MLRKIFKVSIYVRKSYSKGWIEKCGMSAAMGSVVRMAVVVVP
jgi:hypothetical protein